MSEVKVLKDRNLAARGFAYFEGSSVADEGRSVVFGFPSGTRYRVPLEYLLRWLVTPREAHDTLRIVRSRRLKDPHLVRVYLSDGSKYNIVWDAVLMACEPRYEHFGGLTPYFKDLVLQWFKQHDSLRI